MIYKLERVVYTEVEDSRTQSSVEYEPEPPVIVWEKNFFSDEDAVRRAVKVMKKALVPLAEADDEFYLYKQREWEWDPVPLPKVYLASYTFGFAGLFDPPTYHIKYD